MADRLTREQAQALGFAVPKRLSRADAEEIGIPAPPEPTPPPDMDNLKGMGETFVNRAVGNIPLGNLITNLIATPIRAAMGNGGERARLTPEAEAELRAMGEEIPEEPSLIDRYREIRDTRKYRTEEGSKQNPWTGRLGAATGIGLSIAAPLPSVKFAPIRGIPYAAAAERTSRILSGAATGAGYGALNAATDGDADLTRGEVGKAAKEIAGGTAGGAFVGAAASGAAELARPLWRAIQAKAIEQGRRVIGGDSDIAAATRQALSDEAVLQALAERQIRPFSTTPATYQRLDKAAEDLGAEYGQILQRLEELGVTGPRATELAAHFMRRANEMKGGMAASNPAPRTMAKEARTLGQHGQVATNLPLSKAETMKRDFQSMGRHERINNSPNEEAFQELGSKMRQAIEDEVAMAGAASAPGSELGAMAARFVPVKGRLSNTLAARNVGEKGASKALQRSPVGIRDALLGATTSDPATAAVTAMISAGVRNRLPSAMASGNYALSEGLRTGSASPELARMLELVTQPSSSDLSALAEALRKRARREKE